MIGPRSRRGLRNKICRPLQQWELLKEWHPWLNCRTKLRSKANTQGVRANSLEGNLLRILLKKGSLKKMKRKKFRPRNYYLRIWNHTKREQLWAISYTTTRSLPISANTCLVIRLKRKKINTVLTAVIFWMLLGQRSPRPSKLLKRQPFLWSRSMRKTPCRTCRISLLRPRIWLNRWVLLRSFLL